MKNILRIFVNKIINKIFVVNLFGMLLLFGCAATEEHVADKFSKMSSKQIFADGEKELQRKNYSAAIKKFDAIDILYPFCDESKVAQLKTIYAYYKNDEEDLAIASADKYIYLHPVDKNTDYAYYIKGVVYFEKNKNWIQKIYKKYAEEQDLDRLYQAEICFSDLIKLFPNSVYKKTAATYLNYIHYLFVKRELDIAKYYFGKKAFVAAANRVNYALTQLSKTILVSELTKIVSESYKELKK